MPKKRHSTEEIIGKLREVEVLVGRGGSLGEAIRSIGVTQGNRMWLHGGYCTGW